MVLGCTACLQDPKNRATGKVLSLPVHWLPFSLRGGGGLFYAWEAAWVEFSGRHNSRSSQASSDSRMMKVLPCLPPETRNLATRISPEFISRSVELRLRLIPR